MKRKRSAKSRAGTASSAPQLGYNDYSGLTIEAPRDLNRAIRLRFVYRHTDGAFAFPSPRIILRPKGGHGKKTARQYVGIELGLSAELKKLAGTIGSALEKNPDTRFVLEIAAGPSDATYAEVLQARSGTASVKIPATLRLRAPGSGLRPLSLKMSLTLFGALCDGIWGLKKTKRGLWWPDTWCNGTCTKGDCKCFDPWDGRVKKSCWGWQLCVCDDVR